MEEGEEPKVEDIGEDGDADKGGDKDKKKKKIKVKNTPIIRCSNKCFVRSIQMMAVPLSSFDYDDNTHHPRD
jgi:hypothetical protein